LSGLHGPVKIWRASTGNRSLCAWLMQSLSTRLREPLWIVP